MLISLTVQSLIPLLSQAAIFAFSIARFRRWFLFPMNNQSRALVETHFKCCKWGCGIFFFFLVINLLDLLWRVLVCAPACVWLAWQVRAAPALPRESGRRDGALRSQLPLGTRAGFYPGCWFSLLTLPAFLLHYHPACQTPWGLFRWKSSALSVHTHGCSGMQMEDALFIPAQPSHHGPIHSHPNAEVLGVGNYPCGAGVQESSCSSDTSSYPLHDRSVANFSVLSHPFSRGSLQSV